MFVLHEAINKIRIRIWFKLRIIFALSTSIKRWKKYNNTVFLAYSLGKTGSTSIHYTLLKEFPLNRIFHVHTMNSGLWWKEYNKNFLLEKRVRRYLDKHPNRKVIIISLVRDPISRSISDYFHNIKRRKDFIQTINEKKLIEDITTFSDSFLKMSIEWFDSDVKYFTGFDVYNQSFDINAGYKEYCVSEKMKLLIIKTNCISKKGAKALSEFLDEEIDSIYNRNITNDKKLFKDIYLNVKMKYNEPKENIEAKLNNKFVRHFFSSEEIEILRHKYTRK